MPLLCGLLGACGALLIATAPRAAAVLGAGLVVALSALPSEAFLLFVIFMTPVGALLRGDTPVRNVHIVLHALVFAGFFLGLLLRGRLHMRELIRPVISRASLLFLCAAIASTVLSKDRMTHQALRADLTMVVYVSFYFVVLAWVDSRERLRKILRILLLSTIFTALFAFYQMATGGFSSLWWALYPPPPDLQHPNEWVGRAASFLADPNNLAGYLNVVLPFALACFVLGSGHWKRLGKYTFAIGALALLTTQSLGGILAFIAFLFLAVFRFIRSWKRQLAVLGALCASACLFYLLMHILTPVHTHEQLDSDAVTRFALWLRAWDLFTHFPVMGVGWGNLTAFHGFNDPYWVSDQLAAHNIYLQLLSETGVVGLFAFLYLVVQSWRQAQSQWRGSTESIVRALSFGVQGALLSILVHGCVDFFFQSDPQYSTLVFTLLALLVASGSMVPARGVNQARAAQAL